ncbi:MULTISPECIES: Na+/H+ antiporter NhaC [unclassified Exiguobacterium]|uniref:Na+/H+ antiporter NhaC n=1 Tax=unclassified Exiguobacterium TaxID=2644629 RepID=UPI00103B740F|nr:MULTISPECIES: Na+/H+ antiporter NhaC [unclassified Exiguobacterium]TCI44322.1 Na+/H+ antiporter NhaC [Exiguobacterium sp. SH5S32]TCI50586.1 Na+/H+ antiporter NhaC [Exiguobacterium sp. SH1S4]TCI60642.1 Na+/H+ antiporter NhaC [Exiguobacterium sp. SH0S2]TCI67640.1 Na+/H+ antiporter NhaC [Exiguobacterium sp. SH0S7]TCI69546.1 Na+/H+ antiporter NhaC [Exiguobacterium sp. SH1S1]
MQMKGKEAVFVVLMSGISLLALMFLAKATPHMAIFGTMVLIGGYAYYRTRDFKRIETAMINGIREAIMPIMILLLIGMLIGVWQMSGTVATILSIGLNTISAQWFLPSVLLITMIVSSFTGSAFTTVGTVGVALFGIGMALGISPALAAGAIVSGALFGDKMSPLSDTTNFAPAVAGVKLFDHIRFMMGTTVPAIVITLILFTVLGRGGQAADTTQIAEAQTALAGRFNLSWLTLLAPVLVAVLAFRRMPVLPTMLVGMFAGVLTAGFVQGNWNVSNWFGVMQAGFKSGVENETIAAVLDRGGLESMLWSVSLVLIALAFGGLLRELGVFQAIVDALLERLKSPGSSVLSVVLSSIGVNLLAGEQYLSILLPGQAFKQGFIDRGIDPRYLSRALEDGGTVINPLIPWGVSGAFFAATLGVPVLEYAPFAFFLWLSPIFSIVLGYVKLGKQRDAIKLAS